MSMLRIGELAARAGTTGPTIRYYEEIGLLRRPDRKGGGQRAYGEQDVRQLVFIRRCRDFGFSIDQVRSLVAVMQSPARSCMDARDIAQDHLGVIRAKQAELKALERSLVDFVLTCDTACGGGSGPDCVVLDELTRAPQLGGPAG